MTPTLEELSEKLRGTYVGVLEAETAAETTRLALETARATAATARGAARLQAMIAVGAAERRHAHADAIYRSRTHTARGFALQMATDNAERCKAVIDDATKTMAEMIEISTRAHHMYRALWAGEPTNPIDALPWPHRAGSTKGGN